MSISEKLYALHARFKVHEGQEEVNRLTGHPCPAWAVCSLCLAYRPEREAEEEWYRREPSVIASLAGTSVEMIHRNYYEPHAVERARAAVIMPRLREPEAEIGRKVVGIDEAFVVKRVVKTENGSR